MRALKYFLLLNTFTLVPKLSIAQAPPQEKPKPEEHSLPSIPVKVQIVFSEYDGEKKVSSMPYTFTAITNERFGGYYSTSLRTGVRVPIEVTGSEQKVTYMDVGSNIDCGIRTTDDDRYHLYLIFERSALYPNSGAQTEKIPASHLDVPLVRQFKASVNMILKDGQTSETVSTDPINGHSLHVSATINVSK